MKFLFEFYVYSFNYHVRKLIRISLLEWLPSWYTTNLLHRITNFFIFKLSILSQSSINHELHPVAIIKNHCKAVFLYKSKHIDAFNQSELINTGDTTFTGQVTGQFPCKVNERYTTAPFSLLNQWKSIQLYSVWLSIV